MIIISQIMTAALLRQLRVNVMANLHHKDHTPATIRATVAKALANVEHRRAYYAFSEHELLCGNTEFNVCVRKDIHWLHANQLIITPIAKHDRLFAKHAKAVLLDRASKASRNG
jgi:hypothetical protein